MFFKKILMLIVSIFFSFCLYANEQSDIHWYGDGSKNIIDIKIPDSFWIKDPNPEFPTEIFSAKGQEILFSKYPYNKTVYEKNLQLILSEQNISAPLSIAFLLCNEQLCVPNYITLDVEPFPPEYKLIDSRFYIFSLLLVAFIGGLILNIMPCVFPVLSLKFVQFIRNKNASLKHIRTEFLYTAFGIISTFLVLGIMVQILKYFGSLIGWGLQFQSPFFILIMAIILCFFILNLLDLKAIFVPQKILDFFLHKTNKKNQPKRQSYLIGIFITLMATPCSAPFVGTTITAALTVSAIQSLMIFFTIAIGFAMPFILFSLFPQLIAYLPKPGKWLGVFKKMLIIPIFLTLIWLLYLQFQLSLFYFTLTAIALSVLILSLIKSSKIFLVSIVFIFGLSILYFSQTRVEWINYSPEQLETVLNENSYVFINVTADWCITCKVNRKFLLESEKIQMLFNQYHTKLLIADWTDYNQTVSKLMQRYGSYAVPTYILFTPKYKNGIKLSELPTYNEISKYLD